MPDIRDRRTFHAEYPHAHLTYHARLFSPAGPLVSKRKVSPPLPGEPTIEASHYLHSFAESHLHGWAIDLPIEARDEDNLTGIPPIESPALQAFTPTIAYGYVVTEQPDPIYGFMPWYRPTGIPSPQLRFTRYNTSNLTVHQLTQTIGINAPSTGGTIAFALAVIPPPAAPSLPPQALAALPPQVTPPAMPARPGTPTTPITPHGGTP
jgi:hypothetical protein